MFFSSNNDEPNDAKEEIRLQNLISKKLVSIQVEIFVCLACKFETTNEASLKIHISENHSKSGSIQANNSKYFEQSGSVCKNQTKISEPSVSILANHFVVSKQSGFIQGNHSKISEPSGNDQENLLCRESSRIIPKTTLQNLDGQDIASGTKSCLSKDQALDNGLISSAKSQSRKSQLSNDWNSTIPIRRRKDLGQLKSTVHQAKQNIDSMLQIVWNEDEEINDLEDNVPKDNQDEIPEEDDAIQLIGDSMEMDQDAYKQFEQDVNDDILEDEDEIQIVHDSVEMDQEVAKPFKGEKVQKHSIKTGENNFHCDQCTYVTSQHGNLRRHIKVIHTGQKDFQCDSCQATFSDKRSLANHIAVNRSDAGESDVLNCAKYFKITSDPMDFTVRLADGDTFMCLKCKLVATSQESVTAHIKANHELPSRFCCSKCWNWSDRPRKEVIKHWEECNGSIKCADRNLEFESRNPLIKHNEESHPLRFRSGTFQCDECGYCTSVPQHFDRHVKTGILFETFYKKLKWLLLQLGGPKAQLFQIQNIDV